MRSNNFQTNQFRGRWDVMKGPEILKIQSKSTEHYNCNKPGLLYTSLFSTDFLFYYNEFSNVPTIYVCRVKILSAALRYCNFFLRIDTNASKTKYKQSQTYRSLVSRKHTSRKNGKIAFCGRIAFEGRKISAFC